MLEALQLARNALDEKEVPSRYHSVFRLGEKHRLHFLVGCVIVHKDSKIIASGQNEPVRMKNATRHAEICALDTLFAQHDLPTARQVRFSPFAATDLHLRSSSCSVNPFSTSLVSRA